MDARDNVVWHAARGPRRALAEVRPAAARFIPDVAPFAAVADEPDANAWSDLAALLGAGGAAVLVRPEVTVPGDWIIDVHFPGLQMVADDVQARPDDRFVTPTTDEMLALVGITKPGPFLPRTPEFGGYLGHRVDGRLVAMAGERLSTGDHVEISAVCTHPTYQRQGLAAALVRAVLYGIRAQGAEGILHVASENTGAILLYERLGFRVRREFDFAVVRAPGA